MNEATCEKCGFVFDEKELQFNRNDQLVCERCQDDPIMTFNQDFHDSYVRSMKW